MPKPTTLTPYDPNWRAEFNAELDRIAAALGELSARIDHFGSTAVPGLAARPIIDDDLSKGPFIQAVLRAARASG